MPNNSKVGARVLLAMTAASTIALLVGVPALRAQNAPTYRVDPFWPKPLPHKWIMQQVPTLAVGPNDHVWVLNRSRQIRPDENGASTNPPRTDCCVAGPAVLEFDPAGNRLQGWGGPGYVPGWPQEQTINVDRDDHVWISGTGRGESILEFTRDGKLLKDFGHRPPPAPAGAALPPLVENNQQTDVFTSGVAGFDFD